MSEHKVWAMLAEEMDMFPEDFSGRVEDISRVKSAEEALGVVFSDGYRKFITEFGSATFPGHIVYGLDPLEDMGKEALNIVEQTFFYRIHQKWPNIEGWYIISEDGGGNPIGITPDGQVWLSDHNAGFERVLLARSFEGFIYRLLTDTLYEEVH